VDALLFYLNRQTIWLCCSGSCWVESWFIKMPEAWLGQDI